MNWDLLLEILGVTVGVVYLWYEYHADAKVWIASVVMPLISMWLYFRKGLYADFAINIYYVAIAIYGYAVWSFRSKDKGNESKPAKQISHADSSVITLSIIVTGALWALIWWVLRTFTDSTVPVADAFTTALSIVALWIMARKYIEQWIAWIMVDAVCVGLYIYKGIYFYAALYAAYTVIAVFGYRKWHRLMTAR